ncbi:hypothetical protein SCB49_02499 [unidentified eubacterium SCB49]|nr:hypothetical protein SCB49_02499 [unidentified eubacterium SCB49]
MKLRDNFPTTKEDSKSFDVEFRDEVGVFKVFQSEDNHSLSAIEKMIDQVNTFLKKNGYDSISPIEFVKNDFSYESDDEIVSLSKDGYLEEFVLFIERENYINLNKDTIVLLQEFFKNLKSKAIGYSPARHLHTVLEEINALPRQPKQNTFIAFEQENDTYYVAFSSYKMEFSKYVDDFESYEAYRFSYEFSGYTDVVGNFDQFREELLNALNNVKVTDISISDEE